MGLFPGEVSSLVFAYQLHRGVKRLAPTPRGGAPAAPGAVTAEQVALAMLGEESTPAELPGNPGAGGTDKRRKAKGAANEAATAEIEVDMFGAAGIAAE